MVSKAASLSIKANEFQISTPTIVTKVFFCFAFILLLGSSSYAQTQKNTLLMAHYMPWYQSLEYSGAWGWHWTMNYFNPNKINSSGQREIASKYYPVTGPYDSNDSDILEYQVLLMKLSGIDGVLVDWYGDENYYDYSMINKNTGMLFNWIKRANLKFAIVYEDQTIKHMVNGGKIAPANAKTYAAKAINYIYTNWANTNYYLKKDNRPLLLTFGPQYFFSSSEWETIFSGLNPKPIFITLDNILSPVASGAYPWPPMSRSINGVLSQTSLNTYLAQFYQKAANWSYKVGSAFPAFNDIYKEAGVGSSYGFLDPLNGFTFSSTLERAVSQNCDVIQLVTWNDYGEGTIIEPTVEFGTTYLEKVQEVRKRSIDSAFIYSKKDLELPLRIFKLRKNKEWSLFISKGLDDAFQLIIKNDLLKAKKVLDSLSIITKAESETIPTSFELYPNYPNPFNPTTKVKYSISKTSQVSINLVDMLGKKAANIINKLHYPGIYELEFNGSHLTSGAYLIVLQAGNYLKTQKTLLIK
ncbi:MAG: hypothetical protein FD143_876 [Ignavibacteria bacterium]|nr:MAG: hypothetical protein FD143_876 [Ignavibacteria bacterium]KAF0161120.1 MAG: hypothetical protein FD188_1031 [Ignavibacteria bacterium]